MLLHLSVENFILIQSLEIDFHKGFTCITGETGAGKSILVGALGLILGQRADTQVLMDKNEKCIVEGSFSLEDYGLEPLFDNNDLDFENISTFRREINPQGKSRAFINDTPVNLNVMKDIGDRLVDIHSQNHTLDLNEAGFQLSMIDSYSGNSEELTLYSNTFNEYVSIKTELADCLERERKANADQEYYAFQFDELDKAKLLENEQEEIEAALELLTHAEEIKTKLFAAVQLLSDSDLNTLTLLAEAKQLIDSASRYSGQLESAAIRLESSYIELKDIALELQGLSEQVSYDPQRIEFLSQRLDTIYHLQQKHKLSTVNDLILLKDSISFKLNEIDSLEGHISVLQNNLSLKESELSTQAVVLTGKRAAVIPTIALEMETVLNDLGMPSARFHIRLDTIGHFSKTGVDKVSFLFAANKGGEIREIQKVASGGELSRLMLAIKSLVVKRSMLPTILFDEIDSGVSGEIAGKIGTIMRKMSGTMQVIAITHLPQIAGKASQHMLAYKEDGLHNTISSLRILADDERVNEVARMLSDETITETSKAAAKELMGNRE